MPKPIYQPIKLLDGTWYNLLSRIGDGSIIQRFDHYQYPILDSEIVCYPFLMLKFISNACQHNPPCSWCWLRYSTFRFSGDRIYARDYGKIADHCLVFFKSPVCRNRKVRGELLNANELCDSLYTERTANPFSTFIIPLFETQNTHKILFVTKGIEIENLLNIEEHKNTIISYSLNSDEVSMNWEKGAPSIDKRIEAIEKLYQRDYTIRIRLDPIVPFPHSPDLTSAIEGYKRVIDRVFNILTPDRITLGSLRGLNTTMRHCRDKSWLQFLANGEKTSWGLRINHNTRLLLYRSIIDHLHDQYKYNNIGLCKETLGMYKSLGMDFKENRCNCML